MNANTKLAANDFRRNLPRFTPDAINANQALVDFLKKIGERKQATPAQIALAWLLAQKPWIVPSPGTTKLNRLEENLKSAEVKLPPDDLKEIEQAAAAIKVEGERYPPQLMATTGDQQQPDEPYASHYPRCRHPFIRFTSSSRLGNSPCGAHRPSRRRCRSIAATSAVWQAKAFDKAEDRRDHDQC